MQEQIKDSNIFTVDAAYLKPELAAIHIVRDGNRVALVDTGTQHSADEIVKALGELGLDFSAVEWIILTHIHLDHAGGASKLMRLCANARLVVHAKGERHMVDPSKLMAGSIAVYGEDKFRRMYGEIEAIDANRIIVPKDGDSINLGSRELLFIDTPGYANHHHCIVDKQTNSVFTGDTLGVAYRVLRTPEHAFVMPTTTPVQFNPAALHQSIDRVMSYQPETLYLTHYGALQPSAKNIAGLHEKIDDFVMLTQQSADQGLDNLEQNLTDTLTDYLQRRAKNELPDVDDGIIKQWIKADAELNAQGLAFWWQNRRAS